jgi:proprotein convertase subtilisin/kexin type 2
LTSPMGTRSLILSKRPNDEDSIEGFVKWPFMTSHCWGENPKGLWTLEVLVDPKMDKDGVEEGTLTEWTLMLHGTQQPPYMGVTANDERSKLAIAKRAHEKMEKMRKRSI